MSCIFCNIEKERILIENDLAFATHDKFPVSKGHTLIIPKKHTESFFELDDNEIIAMFQLVKKMKSIIDKENSPVGYNVGVNVGESAGQSVFHVHMHLIPRYHNDTKNPRGGVRNVIPGKGDY